MIKVELSFIAITAPVEIGFEKARGDTDPGFGCALYVFVMCSTGGACCENGVVPPLPAGLGDYPDVHLLSVAP
ncbi:hypothetical protein [Streptosporangium carneum]|uniref:Uncharacterized protein n=1 Tax=Streptosporangium carneum TaxID=47481 RepID=A0A9W6MAP2_9ACTN|nr:hypothetical protein [Streptosporangium carneum]GLK07197.1 hypothetical protein GCM10017600_06020 [Streptosporangium carneum]